MLNLLACKSSSEGTFSTKRLIATIVACGVLRVKLQTHNFMLDLAIWQYPTLHDLINSTVYSDNIFELHSNKDNDEKNNCS